MGTPSKILPENFLRRLAPQERAAMGKAALTSAEAQAIVDTRAEKILQKEMAGILSQRNLWFVRSRMDRKTSVRKGVPDFLIVLRGGLHLAVEAKVRGGRISPDQETEFALYQSKTDLPVYIVTDLRGFCDLLDRFTVYLEPDDT